MELRRALLLFAVVLGLAAIATSLSQPSQRRQAEPTQPVGPGGAAEARPGARESRPLRVRFRGGGGRETRRLSTGRAATVVVEVREPGQVELDGLGLTQPAEPITPARFEVLPNRPGIHRVLFIPAGDEEAERVGTLELVRGSERPLTER